MNINLNGAITVANKIFMKAKKLSPELALAGGIACGVGAVIAACVASRHIDEVIDDTRDELDVIQSDLERDAIDIYQARKESFVVYRYAAFTFAKRYAPTIALGMASIGLILLSHGILNKRYVGLSAAYSTLDGAFKDYRQRVKNALGEDAEKIIRAGGHTEKNIKVDNEDGTNSVKRGNSVIVDPNTKNSPYEFDFNRYTAPDAWQADADLNDCFLRAQQAYFTNVLNSRGHVFLNEVLDALGLTRTQAGAVCGWFKGAGDDCVDFGYKTNFIRDYNIDSDLCVKNIHLDFNCDGVIYDMI